jgi:hypothetical protein
MGCRTRLRSFAARRRQVEGCTCSAIMLEVNFLEQGKTLVRTLGIRSQTYAAVYAESSLLCAAMVSGPPALECSFPLRTTYSSVELPHLLAASSYVMSGMDRLPALVRHADFNTIKGWSEDTSMGSTRSSSGNVCR